MTTRVCCPWMLTVFSSQTHLTLQRWKSPQVGSSSYCLNVFIRCLSPSLWPSYWWVTQRKWQASVYLLMKPLSQLWVANSFWAKYLSLPPSKLHIVHGSRVIRDQWEKCIRKNWGIQRWIYFTYTWRAISTAPTLHEPYCTLQFCFNVNIVAFPKHMLLSFTGNISGDIIDELMSSDGKYLASLLF